jgi:hypothetical protein
MIALRAARPDILQDIPTRTGCHCRVCPLQAELKAASRVAHCHSLANGSYVIGLELFHPSEEWTKFSELPRRP